MGRPLMRLSEPERVTCRGPPPSKLPRVPAAIATTLPSEPAQEVIVPAIRQEGLTRRPPHAAKRRRQMKAAEGTRRVG